MKIGILGGSFNPPHKMHYDIANELVENNYIDKVIFVPTGDKYEKDGLVKAIERYEMVKLLIEDNPKLEVSDYELRNGNKYSYETLDHFQRKYPNDTIFFILGRDNLEQINSWKNFNYLISHYYFLIIERDGYSNNEEKNEINCYSPYQDHFIITNVKPQNISSTNIRGLLKEGKNVPFLNEKVKSYIDYHNLYKVEE